LVALRQLDDASVDAVVTDPPAGIEFMGKEWDSFKKKESTTSGQQTESWDSMAEGKKNPYAREGTTRYRGKKNESLRGFQDFICEVFTEVYRVLKPGGHAVVWALPRTSHHTAMGLERAGFDIRDNGTYLFHVFGSGFPKSLDVSKAIDKAAGAEREKVPGPKTGGMASLNKGNAAQGYRDSAYYDEGNMIPSSEPVTDDAKRWTGFGTALKPAYEAWLCCAKPLPLEAECLTLLLDVTTDVFSEALWQRSSASASAADAGLRCFLPHYAKAAASIARGLVRTPSSVSSELAQLAGKVFTRSDLESFEANQRIAAESAAILLAVDPELTTATGRADDFFAVMATSASGSKEAATPWNIALSWSSILADLFALTRTCIIETKTDPTTALKTLRSALTLVTSASITPVNETTTNGDSSLVITVDALLRSARISLQSLATTIAHETATTNTPAQTKAAGNTQTPARGPLTALSPDVEFWILARKPLDGTVAENVLAHGTGALNIDGCRIPHADEKDLEAHKKMVDAIKERGGSMQNSWKNSSDLSGANDVKIEGRWPAHLLLDEGAAATMGEPSRFFYVPKANKRDKDEGLDDLPERSPGEKTDREEGSAGITAYSGSRGISRNNHPTVKSTALMSWLVRLVTPPGGLVLDPFMGSGSTGKAALIEGFSFLGIEREAEYVEIARRRLKHAVGASVDVVRLEEP
jgi:site-specific DNA-methyltransferase (adenine-specific)